MQKRCGKIWQVLPSVQSERWWYWRWRISKIRWFEIRSRPRDEGKSLRFRYQRRWRDHRPILLPRPAVHVWVLHSPQRWVACRVYCQPRINQECKLERCLQLRQNAWGPPERRLGQWSLRWLPRTWCFLQSGDWATGCEYYLALDDWCWGLVNEPSISTHANKSCLYFLSQFYIQTPIYINFHVN